MNRKERVKEEIWCQALKNGHTMRYKALGGSMAPFIKGGSVLTVKPNERIFIGDVILHRSENGLTAHRVIRRQKAGGKSLLVTKGDNLKHKDALVYPSEVLGKVVGVESGERNIQMDSIPRRTFNYFIAIASPIFLSRGLTILRKIRNLAFRKAD